MDREDQNNRRGKETALTGYINSGNAISGGVHISASDVLMNKLKQSETLTEVIKEMSTPLESSETISHRARNVCRPPSYSTLSKAQNRAYPEKTRCLVALDVRDNSGDVQEMDTHSTIKKSFHVPDSDDEESSEDLSETESNTIVKTPYSILDKKNLLQLIENLQKEQEDLKKNQQMHEKHIQELLDREPCVHKHFKFLRRSLVSELDTKLYSKSKDVLQSSPSNMPLPLTVTEEQIYVQLEQLYTNFHVLHFPSKTVQRILGGNNNRNYHEVDSSGEISLLKNKIMELEKKLKTCTNKAPLPPPLPPYGHDHLTRGKLSDRHEDMRYGLSKDLVVVPGRPTSPLPLPPKSTDLLPVEVTFKWTISNYYKKLNKEKLDEGQKEISCPFYLTHCGYKAQMEAYLNGNGTGTNRCMSVFLRVIKGDYDRHLKWPVNLHIVVILVNQSGNHTDSLKAGGNQFQYSQPCGSTDGESDCWGLIEFVSHDMIKQRQYITDDTIELKCRVQILN